ncbi:T9SS type A sorting domain-containing protein [uncultured Chryseobacterium sp.]|uniref:T9SS type A sorting domain-containing protein n=1 Tax=uncultured Chryseobacterium sp. TaxID=259322 RepID=UPI0025E61737|nr:T9SS type A sorting domain-containing protein [uncultured Chryseobacterium sp.]
MLLAFITSVSALRAQTDFVICIDNSGSISSQRFDEISVSAKKLIESILACNPKNRVSVVHYGTDTAEKTYATLIPRIYIESDFTNNISIAQNFTRKMNGGDHFHEALGLMGYALDHYYSAEIISPQTELNHAPSSSLAVVLFSDADRATGNLDNGSYLVNYFDPTVGSPAAFKNVSIFKKNRKARFAVVHMSPDTFSTEAGASIASSGGSYFGSVESNTDDPDFGLSPRLYFGKTDFVLTNSEIQQITNSFCANAGGGSLDMYYELNGCQGFNSVQSVYGSYYLPDGANLVNLELAVVSLATGNQFPVSFSPNFIAPNQYWQQLSVSDFTSVPASEQYGQFKLLITMIYEVGGQIYTASSWNNYPYFNYDITFECTRNAQKTNNNHRKEFKLDRNADPNHYTKTETVNRMILTPNPTDGRFSILMDKAVERGTVNIMDVSGNIIQSSILKNQKETQIDISSQKQGVYIITVMAGSNEIYSQKIIKK